MPRNPVPNTRTFMTNKPTPEPPKKPRSLPSFKFKLPKRSVALPRAGRLPWFIIGILLLVSLFLFTQYHAAQNRLHGDAGANTKAEKQLHKLILLPANETPQVRTVNDATKLHAQPFFANAKNGDKLFIYTKAHRAILYRPGINMIINVEPIAPTPSANQ